MFSFLAPKEKRKEPAEGLCKKEEQTDSEGNVSRYGLAVNRSGSHTDLNLRDPLALAENDSGFMVGVVVLGELCFDRDCGVFL